MYGKLLSTFLPIVGLMLVIIIATHAYASRSHRRRSFCGERRLMLVANIIALLCFGLAMCIDIIDSNPLSFGFIDLSMLVFTAGMAVYLGLILYWFHVRWRNTARLNRFDWKLCINCEYPLAELPESGRCPECGETYLHLNIARTWRNEHLDR